jgi:hypothetical protein
VDAAAALNDEAFGQVADELYAEVIHDPDGTGGVEVVWRDGVTGAYAGHAIFQVRDDEAWWQDLQLATPWRNRRILAHICSTLLKPFRELGVERYVIHDLDMAGGDERIYLSLGFKREGERLVASTATQGALYRTARSKL